MKKLYIPKFFTAAFLFIFLFNYSASAQCPGGEIPGATAYDTTIALGSGIVTTKMKFPKFDPQNGMVTCVKLCVTIKGIIDTIAMENYTNAAQTGSYTYNRKDTIRGPGIPTYLTSNATVTSPTFPLGANNGVFFSGPDFYSQGPDTILTRVICSNISDSTTIVGFYGVNDSVEYEYSVNAILNDIVTGGSAFKFVLSSALVNFNFQYCTCPSHTLPLTLENLTATKIGENKVELSWTDGAETNLYYRFVAEMSRDGKNFTSIGVLPKNTNNNNLYKQLYTTPSQSQTGFYYFRVKQIFANGYTRFSMIKQVYLENSPTAKFVVYPNPSSGIVGIKFDNMESGKMTLQILNSRGQKIMQKNILLAGSSYQQLGRLESGMYWVRLIDEKNRITFVNQVLIK